VDRQLDDGGLAVVAVSDEQLARLLRVVVGAVLLVVAVLAGVAGLRWVAAADDDVPLGVVDIGFLQDMIDHHDQALLIANTYLGRNPVGGAAPYASEVLLFQGRDLARMEAWLTDAGLARGDAGRMAMAWMGGGVAVGSMPGMQTAARIGELAAASGADADRLFFELMSDHHLGGVHMAQYAAENAQRAEIREFAGKMAYNQQIEVVEYSQAVERLGLAA